MPACGLMPRDRRQLRSILSEVHRLGARPVEVKDVHLEAAEADRVVPKGFYTTSNHPTEVKYGGEWIPVECNRDGFPHCCRSQKETGIGRSPGKNQKRRLVVVGEQGVSVNYPERPREESTFEFMHGTVSSERPSETLIAKIAKEILEVRKNGGKIAVVGGPAIIHTGADKALAE